MQLQVFNSISFQIYSIFFLEHLFLTSKLFMRDSYTIPMLEPMLKETKKCYWHFPAVPDWVIWWTSKNAFGMTDTLAGNI